MNKERLKEIITQLKDITAELESEVYSDLEAYKKMRECYPSIRAAYFIKTRPIIL